MYFISKIVIHTHTHKRTPKGLGDTKAFGTENLLNTLNPSAVTKPRPPAQVALSDS